MRFKPLGAALLVATYLAALICCAGYLGLVDFGHPSRALYAWAALFLLCAVALRRRAVWALPTLPLALYGPIAFVAALREACDIGCPPGLQTT